MADEDNIEMQLQLNLPPELEAGQYADFASVWHNANSFVIDFAALKQPPSLQETEDGQKIGVQQARVVARLRIPPQQVFELARALTQTLDVWEQATGQRPPEEPGFPTTPE